MRLSLCTHHSTEGRLLWSLKTLPQEQRDVLVQQEGKGQESQNTDNVVSTVTTSPAMPAPIHQFSGPLYPSLTVPYPISRFWTAPTSNGCGFWASCPSTVPEPCPAHAGSLRCTCTASWTCQTCCGWQVGLGHMIITLVIPPQIQVNTWYKSPWTREMTLKTATAKDERSSEK